MIRPRLGLPPYPRRAYPWRRVVACDPLSGLPSDAVFDLMHRRCWTLARTIGRAGYRLPPGAVADMWRQVCQAEARGELPF